MFFILIVGKKLQKGQRFIFYSDFTGWKMKGRNKTLSDLSDFNNILNNKLYAIYNTINNNNSSLGSVK